MVRQTKEAVIPYKSFQETMTKQGIKATVRIETVLQATMPSGSSARGKYQVITDYEAAEGREVELTFEQSKRGRALTKHLRERLEEQMKQVGWKKARRSADEQPLVGRNGLLIWEYQPSSGGSVEMTSRHTKARAH